MSNQVDCAKLLIEHGCNANIANAAGERAYDMAVKFGRQDVGMAIEGHTSEAGDKIIKGDGTVGTLGNEENEDIQTDIKDIMKDGLVTDDTAKLSDVCPSKIGNTIEEMESVETQEMDKLVIEDHPDGQNDASAQDQSKDEKDIQKFSDSPATGK